MLCLAYYKPPKKIYLSFITSVNILNEYLRDLLRISHTFIKKPISLIRGVFVEFMQQKGLQTHWKFAAHHL